MVKHWERFSTILLIEVSSEIGRSRLRVFRNLLFKPDLMWPEDEYLPPAAVDLVEKLLAFEPSERLGHNGVEEVKSHEWFADVDWDTLLEQVQLLFGMHIVLSIH